jgi:hypothetical protein
VVERLDGKYKQTGAGAPITDTTLYALIAGVVVNDPYGGIRKQRYP